MKRFLALVGALTLVHCHPNTAFVEVSVANIPSGAARLLLSVRLLYEIAAPISPLNIPADDGLKVATLGLRLPTTTGFDEQPLVVGAGIVDQNDCPLAVGLTQAPYRNLDSKLTIELAPTPSQAPRACSLLQPVIFGVTPRSGPSSGHTFMSLHGWAFDEQASVTINGLPVSTPRWESSNEMSVYTPAALGVYGPVPIQVANRDNSSVENRNLFSYYASVIALTGHLSAEKTTPGPWLFALGSVSGGSAGPELVRVSGQTGDVEILGNLASRDPAQKETPVSLRVTPSAVALTSAGAAKSDLIYTTSGDGGVVRFRNQSGQAGVPPFSAQAMSRTFVGLSASAAASVQFAGSGSADLVIADQIFDEINVLYRQSDGSFARKARASYSVDREPIALLTADVNGDQRPDLVIGHRNRNTVTALVQSIGVTPSAQPLQGFQIPLPTAYAALATGDLDGDGSADLIYAENAAGQSTLHIVYLKPGGAGQPSPSRAPSGQTELTGLAPITSLLGVDLNGDGSAEIIAATATPELLVFTRDASGSLVAVTTVSAPTHPVTTLLPVANGALRLTDILGVDAASGAVTYWKNTSQ